MSNFCARSQNIKIVTVTYGKANGEVQPRGDYEHRPTQYTEKILVVKVKIFTGIFFIFSYFCAEHRLWVHVRTASARQF